MNKVICASGYFNPLHVGHIQYLKAARALGDSLIVIINNDDQVKLKGSIPFMSEDDRAVIIKELACVNAVIIAVDKDSTVNATLELVRPSVFANGGDVTPDNFREAETCKKLKITPVFGVGGATKIQSSSALLGRCIPK